METAICVTGWVGLPEGPEGLLPVGEEMGGTEVLFHRVFLGEARLRGSGMRRFCCRLRRMAAVAAWAVMLLAMVPVAQAAERLSASGTRLSNLFYDPAVEEFSVTIDLGGDVPDRVHVMLREGGRMLQRSRNGYWLPWNGDVSVLRDAGFRAQGGTLTYKITAEDLSGRMFPLKFTLAYTVGGVMKFGVFQIMPKE